MTLLQDLDRQIDILSNQILAADFRGYDPYDLFHRLAPIPDNLFGRFGRKAARIANRISPLPVRLILGIKPEVNPKALGLCLRSFALLHERERASGRWYAAADRALQLLTENRSENYAMPVWGYPFDWRSRILIPKATPSAVVNAIIADGMMEWYRVSGESQFLEMSCGICQFFVQHLNRTVTHDGRVCFSYTPLDHFHVHNANLFVAETLVKVGTITGHSDWIQLGKQAASYTLGDQRDDGSLSYWASDQMEAGNPRIDHYHSGFEIRMLYRLGRLLHDRQFMSAAVRYYAFYKSDLLHRCNGLIMPKFTPNSIYPVDIHSCAELIILNSELTHESTFSESGEILKQGTEWVLRTMFDENGEVFSRIENLGFFTMRIRIPYVRWAMAWILLALVLSRKQLSGLGILHSEY